MSSNKSSATHPSPNPRLKAKKQQKKSSFSILRLVAIFVVPYMAFLLFSRSGFFKKTLQRLGFLKGKSASTYVNGLPTYFTLPSGDKIPSVALGVWKAEPADVKGAVKAALEAGYRHIDEAWAYGNEAEVGEVIKASGIPRKDIWITSKLWNNHHAPEDVEGAIDESLSKLGTDYLDLYLIHWPVAFGKDGKLDVKLTENPYPTWKKLEEMVEKGKVKNIGVANFNIRRMEELLAQPLKIKPAVNQVELNYWNPQPELLKWAKEKGILLQAYSPLGSSDKVKETLELPEVKDVAKELGITPAQVIISWHIQRGTVVLPKSVTPSRVVENLKVTALPQAAFDRLEKAATSHEPIKVLDPSPHWGVDLWDVKLKK